MPASSHVLPALEVRESPYTRLPGAILALFAVGAILGLATPNPGLTAASVLALPAFMTLLWRQGEPPVLLLAVGYQWVQVTSKVFHANVLGIPVDQLAEFGTVSGTIWLSLGGLGVLAVGMRLGMWKLGRTDATEAQRQAEAFSVERAFALYLVGTVVASLVGQYAWSVAGLAQQLIALVNAKWLFFFLLGYVVLQQRSGYSYFLVAILLEFVGGIGFFSGFKTVFFVTLLVVFTVRYQLKAGTILTGVALMVAVLLAGATWTSIKGEYRGILNEGEGGQVTNISRSEQLNQITVLIDRLEFEDILLATDPMFRRLSYVDYFALTREYVPRYAPHEDGALWTQSILHVLRPRVFFPNKPVLPSDSEMTMRYTGLFLAGSDQGTSISIGYMGESYIDFGAVGMFFPILLIGLTWGGIYYYFMSRARSPLLGYAFALVVLLGAYQFEMASIKLLGGIVNSFLVYALLLRFAESHIVSKLQGSPTLRYRPTESWAH